MGSVGDASDNAMAELAFAQSRASGKQRREQLDSMLEDRSWEEVAQFAAYGRQFVSLKLKPWQTPPCFVADENEPRVGEEEAAKLLRRMLRAGISRWHPDPMAALEAVAG